MKNIIKLVLSLLISGTALAQNKKVLKADEFEKAINNNEDITVLDVRRPDEFAEGHINKAININWQDPEEFKTKASQLDKSKPVYIYCLAGVRSEKATDWLLKNGFKNVVGLDGGIKAWKDAGKPLDPNQTNTK
jgi:rhodanese-related sulfurtransferase